jgi:hypothetical protein
LAAATVRRAECTRALVAPFCPHTVVGSCVRARGPLRLVSICLLCWSLLKLFSDSRLEPQTTMPTRRHHSRTPPQCMTRPDSTHCAAAPSWLFEPSSIRARVHSVSPSRAEGGTGARRINILHPPYYRTRGLLLRRSPRIAVGSDGACAPALTVHSMVKAQRSRHRRRA